MELGQNIKATVSGSRLTLEIDLSQEIGLSQSQKSMLIASTGPAAKLPGGVSVGVNVYKSARVGRA